MRKITNQTEKFTKRDSANSRNGLPLQELEHKSTLHIIAAAIMEDTDEETNETKEIGVFVTGEKEYYTTISATVIDTMYDLIDIMSDEGEVDVRIEKRKSKGGREFLSLVIL